MRRNRGREWQECGPGSAIERPPGRPTFSAIGEPLDAGTPPRTSKQRGRERGVTETLRERAAFVAENGSPGAALIAREVLRTGSVLTAAEALGVSADVVYWALRPMVH